MVRLRLKRMGRTHRPFYRLNAIDKNQQRDGKVLENLGWYDPVSRDESKQVSLNVERIKHWLSIGAQPSDTVADLLARHNVIDPEQRRAERLSRVAKKIEAQEAAKQAADAKAKADAEAAAAAAKAKADAEAAAAAAKAKADAEAAAASAESPSAEG